jgi:transcriptional regulator with XRE-family HTH domain
MIQAMDYRRKSLQELVKENAARLKDSRDLSEQRIAARGGPSQRTVNRLLNGENLTLKSVDRAAKAFGLEPWHLCVPHMDIAQLAQQPEAEYKAGRGAAKLWKKYRRADPNVREAIDALLGKGETPEDEPLSVVSRKSA